MTEEEKKDRIKAQKRAWYENNKERILAQQAEYRKSHQEQIKQYRERTRETKNAKNREYMKGYYEKNRNAICEYQKEYYRKNADKVKERVSSYYEENKEHIKPRLKRYRAEHSTEHAEYINRRRKEDPQYKLICSVRNLLNNAFNKRTKVGKTKQAEEILGCSIDFFIEHLQSQFQEGMTVENHGEWHIDHIIPLATAKSEEDVIRLNHYTNLRPLWAIDNLTRPRKTP